MRALLKLLRFLWSSFGFDAEDVRDLWKWIAGFGVTSAAYAYAVTSFQWFHSLPLVTQIFAAIALALAIVMGLSYLWPRKAKSTPSPEPARDLVAEGRERAARQQIRRHVLDVVRKYVLPGQETASKALRGIVGQLPDEPRVMTELVRVYTMLLADGDERMGQLNVTANRSMQDAPEESKPSLDDLVEMLIDSVSRYFHLCDMIDGVRVLPAVLLRPHPAIAEWKEAREKLKRELQHTAHVDGLGAVRRLSPYLQPDDLPPNAPRIVPKRYGHRSLIPSKGLEEGLFVENLGGPARGVVVQPFQLGFRTVRFSGPEIGQLKRDDGERLFEVGVEGPPHHTSLDLFPSFREWQQERGDLTLETVGTITFADFDGNRYETFFRIGIDVLNTDGGIVVEFLEQRRL